MRGQRSGRTWLIVLAVLWIAFLAALGVALFVPGIGPGETVGTTVDREQEQQDQQERQNRQDRANGSEGAPADGDAAGEPGDDARDDGGPQGQQDGQQAQEGQDGEDGGPQDADGQADDDGGGEVQAEGWYGEDQAGEGADAYAQNCAQCHGEELQGAGGQPALEGDPFWDAWGGESVQALYDYTAEQMPLTDPGSLDDRTYAAIIAHVLSVNGLPAGGGPLEPGSDRMQNLVLERDAATEGRVQNGQRQQ